MKNFERIVIRIVFLILCIVLFLDFTIAQRDVETNDSFNNEKYYLNERFCVSLDSRIELLAVVQHFTSWANKGHIKSNTQYKTDIDEYFKAYKDHPVIAKADSLIKTGFAYDAPVHLMLYHNNPPELSQITPYNDYLIKRAGGEEILHEFMNLLRDFANVSDFMKFFKDHDSLSDTLTLEVVSLLGGKGYIASLEDFYGHTNNSYNLVLSPLFSGNYGIPVITKNEKHLYAVIGPCTLKGNRSTFSCLDYLENMILHEWSHSFVNPLVDKHYNMFEKSSNLFKPIKRLMQRQAYPNWRVSIYEHLVRACGEIHIKSNIYTDFNKEKPIKYNEGRGFWYISYIDSLLNIYDAHREQYEDLDEFIPVIATMLNELSIEDLPERITTFIGPLDAVFTRTDRIHLVYPTGIQDEDLKIIKKEVNSFAGFLTSVRIDPVIVSDREALELEWEEKVAFIYGNSGNNIFLSELEIAIPLNFCEGALEFQGKRYEGDGIVLISCLPNPYNKNLPFCICASNNPKDLISIESRIQGPTEWYVDYILYRGDQKLKTGLYKKEYNKWLIISEQE